MRYTVEEIAVLVRGKAVGEKDRVITGMARIEDATLADITFISSDKYVSYLDGRSIGAVLVGREFDTAAYEGYTFIVVEDVAACIQRMLEQQSGEDAQERIIEDSAAVHSDVAIGTSPSIGVYTVVECGAQIGNNVTIGSHCYIGKEVVLEDGVYLHPGVRVLDKCRVGKRTVIHSNTVVGSDGFGFKPNAEGVYKKINHVGNVVIGDDVEIGANVCIDRAVMGSTIIEEGVKLDNLIHIAHNVRVSKHTVIAAQAGIAGSTTIGAHSMIGGQVGIVGHIRIEDGTQIQAQSGVMSNHRGEKKLFGYPAIAYGDYLKSYAIFKKLPQLYKEINELRKQLMDK